MFAARGGFLAQPVSSGGGTSMFLPKSTVSSPAPRVYCTASTALIQWYASTGYTLEYWVYVPSFSPWSGTWTGAGNHNGAGIDYWTIFPGANGVLSFYAYPVATYSTPTSSIAANTWTHVAVSVQYSSPNITFRMFVNGVAQSINGGGTTVTNTASSYQSASGTGFSIGQRSTGTNSNSFYVDDLRVSNIARYTSNFTPPTSPFTNDGNTLLLMNMDGTNGTTGPFIDSSSFNRSFTNATSTPRITISSAQYKF